jgi:hypothetical protein
MQFGGVYVEREGSETEVVGGKGHRFDFPLLVRKKNSLRILNPGKQKPSNILGSMFPNWNSPGPFSILCSVIHLSSPFHPACIAEFVELRDLSRVKRRR